MIVLYPKRHHARSYEIQYIISLFERQSNLDTRWFFSSLDFLSEFVSSLITFGKYLLCFPSLPSPTLVLSHSMNWMLPQISLYNTNYIQLLGAWCLLGLFYGIISLLRHSILRQSLLRHLLLRLLILRQWPIVFAILALLAIQMQYGTAHLTWKGHGFYPGVGGFFRMQRYCF